MSGNTIEVSQVQDIPHISVLVCTFKRPVLLAKLLIRLQSQVTDDRFTYSVVVIDNDRSQSARKVVESAVTGTAPIIDYDVEPVQNIALARNKAVAVANGELLAFIDDDEFPDQHWLRDLYVSMVQFGADGILGPVKPHFELVPPEWIIKGKFCERESFRTGTLLLNPVHTRTGNVLLSRGLFDGNAVPFDPSFGRTGGEDIDFFKRMLQMNKRFVWCDEASVHESVPPERCTRSYFLRRALLRGVANSQRATLFSANGLKSIVAIAAYSAALPALLFCRHDLFMRYAIKDCDHIGKVLALCGIRIVRERSW